MYRDLSHLDKSELTTLINRYYDGESATRLIAEYDLLVSPSHLYKIFPPEEFPQYSCEYCNRPLVMDRRSKASKNMPKYEKDLYCPVCGHYQYREICKCENCIAENIKIEASQRATIQEYYSKQRAHIDFQELSFREKVFLGALCRALMEENMFEIAPLSKSPMVLAPTPKLESEIYHTLLGADVISVSPNSPLDAFVLDDDVFPRSVYLTRAVYELNLKFPPNKQELFTEIMNPSYYSPEFSGDALSLWTQIAVSECIEYLQYQFNRVGFEFSPGEKTYKTFEIILNDFSVSQIYGIIWGRVAEASKLYLEKGISKQHAANSVIGACERFAERAKINHWNLKTYSRIRDLPQSALSAFFFNRVLGIGDMGFDMPPTPL